jgi:hypothetical protein
MPAPLSRAEVEEIVRKTVREPGVVPIAPAVFPDFGHVPTDADFASTPRNGVAAMNGADFYVRVGGTWKKATLA